MQHEKRSIPKGGNRQSPGLIERFKLFVLVAGCGPFLMMSTEAIFDKLGPNPVEHLLSDSGTWAVRFLLISLAVTPLRMLTGINEINKFRRMMGLFAFFYCSVHVVVYVFLEHQMDVEYIVEDFLLSPVAQVGLITYGILIPMALTSTKGMMKRLGKAWKKIHNAVHVAGLLAILHFVLTVKADITRPLVYFSILISLELIRGIYRRYREVFRVTFSK